MTTYHLHEGTFSLPDGWRDQSMNVFRLPGQGGAKDVAILITRDADTTVKSAREYANAQHKLAQNSFAGFKLLGSTDVTIDGQPAALLDYQWRSNGNALLRQRQAYVLHEGKALILTVSALAAEFAPVEPAWQQVVTSFKLLVRPPEEDASAVAAPAHVDAYVFAHSPRGRSLFVYADAEEACREVDSFEVEDGHWAFFSSVGAPLRASFLIQNRHSVPQPEPGLYRLVPDPSNLDRLSVDRLNGTALKRGLAPLDTPEAIEDHLEQFLPWHGTERWSP